MSSPMDEEVHINLFPPTEVKPREGAAPHCGPITIADC